MVPRMEYDDDIHAIARVMIRHYGDAAGELMERRAVTCRRYGDGDTALFWEFVAQEVARLRTAPPASSTAGAVQRHTGTAEPVAPSR